MVKNNSEELEDEELVRLSLQDPDNFSDLINRYQAKILYYVRRLGVSTLEDSQDIVQDIFLKVYLNLNDFKPDLKFSSWLYRIAHNQVISNFRKHQARPEAYSSPLDDAALNLLSGDILPDSQIDKNILKASLMASINKLEPKYREIIILKFFEEKSYQEISDILRKPEGSVASLLNRAKKSLKKILPINIDKFYVR
jgi:RNA polymerase sigma-70 factor (ECF subfamily)